MAPFLNPEEFITTPGSMLRHYKGGLYRVVGVCRIEATLETGVLYQACQGDADVTWMRPLSQFHDMVDTPSGRVPRFARIPPDAAPPGN